MTYDEAKQILSDNQQAHILKFWDTLAADQQQSLLAQIATLDFDAITKMRAMLKNSGDSATPAKSSAMEPAFVSTLEGEAEDAATNIGVAEIRNGHVAVLVVAGGQGSRLGYDGPKGCYPVGPISDESLFFFHARKILALEKKYDTVVPFYIMTSTTNDAQTRAFFADNNYFGLDKANVFFFVQSMWPALDADGKIILSSPSEIFMGPDGHGGTLTALALSGGLDDMMKRDIQSVFYFQVDNPMVNIADPAFIGFHRQNLADVSTKVCAKRDPDEGLGVIVVRDGKTEIVEYTELTKEQKNERTDDGELRYKYGSVAIHVFAVTFLEKEVAAGLPLHIAHKKVPYCDDAGNTVKPDAPNAYKFEKFIFDTLTDAQASCSLAFDRTQEFSPVKNADGNDSPETCKNDLMAKWAGWLDACGVKIPRDANGKPTVKIEIDPAFAHSARALAKKLDGVAIDTSKDIWLK